MSFLHESICRDNYLQWPLPSPASFPRTAALPKKTLHRHPEVDVCKRHLMDMREPTCSSHKAGSENPKSHLPVLYLVLYPALSTLFTSKVTHYYGLAGEFTESHFVPHRPQHLLQLKPVWGHWYRRGRIPQFPPFSFTKLLTPTGIAFKEPKREPHLNSFGLSKWKIIPYFLNATMKNPWNTTSKLYCSLTCW